MVRKLKHLDETVEVEGQEEGQAQDIFEAEDEAIKAKVQRGAELDAVMKNLKKELDAIKDELKAYAKENKLKALESPAGDWLKFTSSSSTTVTSVIEFVKLLKKLKKQNLINDLLKVEISKVKKVLGDDVLDEVSTTSTEPYGRMTFTMAARDINMVKKSILE